MWLISYALLKTRTGLLLLFFPATLSFRKPLFDINCCHAAKARGSYGLSVSVIMNVSSSKHTFNACLRVLREYDIALIVKLKLPAENSSVGLVADCYEEASCIDSPFITGVDVLD